VERDTTIDFFWGITVGLHKHSNVWHQFFLFLKETNTFKSSFFWTFYFFLFITVSTKIY